ncbi:MAG: MraY family glycosyltransferase [Gemmatimonadota bacterium]|nr:MraY family glycosyltransferase [Gemmatimonadota bacterium]
MQISREVFNSALFTLVGTSLLSFLLIVFFKRLALHAHVVDKPREDRFHEHQVPLLGGNAIYLTFLAGLVFKGFISPLTGLVMLVGLGVLFYGILRDRKRLPLYFAFAVIWCSAIGLLAGNGSQNQLLGLLMGGTILVLVGNVDDVSGGMMPYVKLVGQIVAGFFLIYFGIRVNFFIDLGVEWGYPSLKYLTYPFTLFWIIGMTNAFNLIDNMNGLSCGVAIIASLYFGLISFVNSQVEPGFIFFIFMGAGLGFLPHNFPRARIFMGDSGSLFIGFVIAGLSIMGSWHTASGWVTDRFKLSLAIPLLVLIYPIFDTVLVTVTRIMRGRPVSLGGKDHSSHRLVKMGLHPTDVVLIIYTFVSFTGFSALFLTMIRYDHALLMLAYLVLFIILVGLRLAKIKIDE